MILAEKMQLFFSFAPLSLLFKEWPWFSDTQTTKDVLLNSFGTSYTKLLFKIRSVSKTSPISSKFWKTPVSTVRK